MRNGLLELIAIKMIGARFVGTGGFLIRYSNGYIK
jgi:hypothetical protein